MLSRPDSIDAPESADFGRSIPGEADDPVALARVAILDGDIASLGRGVKSGCGDGEQPRIPADKTGGSVPQPSLKGAQAGVSFDPVAHRTQQRALVAPGGEVAEETVACVAKREGSGEEPAFMRRALAFSRLRNGGHGLRPARPLRVSWYCRYPGERT